MKKIALLALVLVLLSTAVVVRYVRPVESDWTWTETIYIRADGSADPSAAPISSADNITYALTDNIVGDVSVLSSAIVVERDNIVVDGAGYTLQGTGWGIGINMLERSNVTIKNINVKEFLFGIHLLGSSNNKICGNNITNNVQGIVLDNSSHITISGNNITNNRWGLSLQWCSSNTINENRITENYAFGIWLSLHSNYNSISGSNITENQRGIQLSSSSNNTVSENYITNNGYGIYLLDSSNNRFWHNNIVINVQQMYIYLSGNASVWDDGYPSGGNYWSDYSGVDEFSGPYQNVTGSDGIGDTPYVIDENNQDNYPLMSPWIPEEEVPFWMQWWLWTIVAVVIVALAGAVYFLKKRKPPTPTAPTPSTEGTFQNIHNKDYSETQSTTMRAICSS